jgi:predicted nucleic acid-binding protein
LSGLTLDAGALIALDRNDRRVIALIARAAERGRRLTIPASALAQAIRNQAQQSRLSRLVRQADVDLAPLDGMDATAVGIMLARTGTTDVVDAHVVLCARRAGQPVVTGDAKDLRQIAPDLELVPI